ncbi:MAG: cobyric acid synthase [Phycisphaeraceae bacterium]
MSSTRKSARCLAVLGTGSDVGKSIIVTGLCRLYRGRGVDVAPFKAQNMSNNSYVTLDGGEMGRAQIVQAQAARVEPTVDMNPVLLKPSADITAQVIVQGKAIGTRQASEYFADTDALFASARQSLGRLRDRHELIIMEGAGSCGEVNLRSRDFVNFRMAHAADAPVVLVADIDKGGVFAQIVGTMEVIPEEDRQRVAGFIVNRFRGDAALFADGIAWIQQRTGLPVLGLVPWFYHIQIDSEDGMPLDVVIDPPHAPADGRINIAVIRLPHISNFTDFNPLTREAPVALHYLSRPRDLRRYDLLILPGTKNVRSDLDWLRQTGWDQRIVEYVERGGQLAGVCGGYQMLGRAVHDPHGVEGAPGKTDGLGLLDLDTTLAAQKTLTRTIGRWRDLDSPVDGYEIHMGVTRRGADLKSVLDVTARSGQAVHDTDGAASADGRIWGVYLHGLFDGQAARRAFLRRLGPALASELPDDDLATLAEFQDRQYDLLAEHLRQHLDIDAMDRIIGL